MRWGGGGGGGRRWVYFDIVVYLFLLTDLFLSATSNFYCTVVCIIVRSEEM